MAEKQEPQEKEDPFEGLINQRSAEETRKALAERLARPKPKK